MKFIHISDLHLGLSLYSQDLIEDQKDIFDKIVLIAKEEKTDGVIIAGDIYDTSIPPVCAVNLFDNFLTNLVKANQKVFIISGNHDSADRVSFGNKMMTTAGVYIAPIFDGNICPITFSDDFGPINIYLLPFVKPIQVKHIYENENLEISSSDYDKAMSRIVEHLTINKIERNILVTHQFVGAETKTCDSEFALLMGNIDRVSATVFADFDYVALGHIHSPQNVTKDGKIRYCGTPLKYSFSECGSDKTATVVEFCEKNNFSVKEIPLKPLHDVNEICDKFDVIMNSDKYVDFIDDYVSITLTDEDEIPDDYAKLKSKFHFLLRKDYNNSRTQQNDNQFTDSIDIKNNTPFELFEMFFKRTNNVEMNEEQKTFMKDLIAEIFEEAK